MSRARRAALAAAVAATLALAVPAGIGAAVGGGNGGGNGAGGGDTTPPVVTIELVAQHSRFSPSAVSVPAGSTVRFVVRNLDPIDHELIVGGAEVHRRHEAGREAHHHGDVPGEITVPAGATVSTTWTAPAAATDPANPGATTDPSAAGALTFACHLPGHLAYGMSGTIEVTTRS